MKGYNLLCLSILFNFYLVVNGQNYSKVISDGEIRTFFAELQSNKSLKIDKVDQIPIRWSDLDLVDQIDSSSDLLWGPTALSHDSVQKYLDSNDIRFVVDQVFASENFIWRKSDFRSFSLIDTVGVALIYKKSKKKGRGRNNYCYSFSLPLFSRNKQFVLLRQKYLCGFLCMTECIYFYRKTKNNKWILIDNWQCFSS
jgi:hypothetical protein